MGVGAQPALSACSGFPLGLKMEREREREREGKKLGVPYRPASVKYCAYNLCVVLCVEL